MENAQTIISGNKIYRPLLNDILTDDDLQVAIKELNETPERREEALRIFKDMLREQNEFTPRTDNVFLLRFLRCKKYDCDKAFKMVHDYYKFRLANPKVYIPPSGCEMALKAGIFNYLPHRDHKGRAIFVVKFGLWNTDKISYTELVAAGNLFGDYLTDNAVTQINGYIGIWDYKGFGFKHCLPFLSASNISLVANLMQDRFPGRFKIAYCVNCISLVNTAWSFIRRFMKEKFKDRIQILSGDVKQLHQYIDPAILPAEFGGTLGMPENKDICNKILSKEHEQYVNYNRKFGF